MRQRLIEGNIADEAALRTIETEANTQIDDALQFARESDYPDISELGRDVYAEEVLV
jgi:pyruvate dehydrogenase E1 component alpha subunit